MIEIAIATCSAFPDLGPYDRCLLEALTKLGIRATPRVWNDNKVSWHEAAAVVIQSTWDSHLDPASFLAWAGRVAPRTPVLNPPRMLEWNLHKGYLRELESKRIPVTPTKWVAQGSTMDLKGLLLADDWSRIVIKPAVSAGATETHVFDRSEWETAQSTVNRLAAAGDVMVQPYLEAFETEGERSYVFIDGAFSHAVDRPPTLKSAPRSFEKSRLIETPDERELQLARNVIDAVEGTPLYARVDVATNNDGVVRLQELELVEPCLFLSLAPAADERLAGAISRRLRQK